MDIYLGFVGFFIYNKTMNLPPLDILIANIALGIFSFFLGVTLFRNNKKSNVCVIVTLLFFFIAIASTTLGLAYLDVGLGIFGVDELWIIGLLALGAVGFLGTIFGFSLIFTHYLLNWLLFLLLIPLFILYSLYAIFVDSLILVGVSAYLVSALVLLVGLVRKYIETRKQAFIVGILSLFLMLVGSYIQWLGFTGDLDIKDHNIIWHLFQGFGLFLFYYAFKDLSFIGLELTGPSSGKLVDVYVKERIGVLLILVVTFIAVPIIVKQMPYGRALITNQLYFFQQNEFLKRQNETLQNNLKFANVEKLYEGILRSTISFQDESDQLVIMEGKFQFQICASIVNGILVHSKYAKCHGDTILINNGVGSISHILKYTNKNQLNLGTGIGIAAVDLKVNNEPQKTELLMYTVSGSNPNNVRSVKYTRVIDSIEIGENIQIDGISMNNGIITLYMCAQDNSYTCTSATVYLKRFKFDNYGNKVEAYVHPDQDK